MHRCIAWRLHSPHFRKKYRRISSAGVCFLAVLCCGLSKVQSYAFFPEFSSGLDQTCGSGLEVSNIFLVGSGRVSMCSKSHGSERVESGVFQVSQVGSGHPDVARPARSDTSRESPVFFSPSNDARRCGAPIATDVESRHTTKTTKRSGLLTVEISKGLCTVPVACYNAFEIAWRRWEQPLVAVCGIVQLPL